MPRTRLYRQGQLIGEDFPIEQVSDHLTDPEHVVWVDMCAPTREELERTAEELSLHELAVEDAVTPHERPKLDRYRSHLFLTASEVSFDAEAAALTCHEVAAFVTRQALITVHRSPDVDLRAVTARWDESSDLAASGVAFLLHGLLDHLVDSHFGAVQAMDDQIEELEDLLFQDRPLPREIQRRSFRLRKSLVLLRRVVMPMREVVNSLMRRDVEVVDAQMMPYYQDVYDHVLRATEWTESLRDLVSTVLETHLTIQGNRMNDTMKQVTSWAAIIAVPTAITGFYGQNVPYPGYGHWSGFLSSTVVMIVTSGGLYLAFRRREWL